MGVKCKGKWTRAQGNSKSVIDYVITKDSDDIVETMVIDEEKQFSVYYREGEKTIYSDHYAIEIKMNWLTMIRQINKKKKIEVMTEQGYISYKNKLSQSKISENINRENDIDEEYERWSDKVQKHFEAQLKKVKR